MMTYRIPMPGGRMGEALPSGEYALIRLEGGQAAGGPPAEPEDAIERIERLALEIMESDLDLGAYRRAEEIWIIAGELRRRRR